MKYGPWFINFTGEPCIRRQMFDDDGEPAGYELLDGDFSYFTEVYEALCEIVNELDNYMQRELLRDAIVRAHVAITKVEGN